MKDLLIILLFIGCGIALFFWQQARSRAAGLKQDVEKSQAQNEIDNNQWANRVADLDAEVKRLAKWQTIEDAEGKAAEILKSAKETLERAAYEAAQMKSSAQQESATVTSEARRQAAEVKERAEAALSSALLKASEIVDKAEKQAIEIAGSAYEAKKNSEMYQDVVKAMKNIIEGYGNQYIIPSHSLLDDLADDFSHAQAGQELKRAREVTKALVRTGGAAICDYVEDTRRDTAIAFVIDAFNGKVDSVLSLVRHDNAGTLQQRVRDAFTLVNTNDKAFRNAKITEQYLNARLDELKWAAVAQQLKLEEREEQRRINEQIREEEKARKEYERALRETAREEDLLRKAMEKAHKQIEQASAEQKARYEEQLKELEEKLKAAEERSQRALSMAQQTKRGHVYVISNIGSLGEHVYKIGLTRRLDPEDRIRELGDSSVPFGFDIHAMIFSDDAPALEAKLHKQMVMSQVNKVNYRKEFFKADLSSIREEVEAMGLSAHWTLVAEAREYRETLAIEKAISEDPEALNAWLKRQLELEKVTMEDETIVARVEAI